MLAMLLVCCSKRPGALLAAICPNMGVAEGAVAVLLVSWLKAELELAAGGCVKTEEPEVTVPNTVVSVAGLGATLETAAEVVGGPAVSAVTGTAPGVVAAVTAVCPGTGRVGAGDAGSVLPSGTAAAAGAASVAGARRPAPDATALGLPATGWTEVGSLLTGSDAGRGAWGGGAACCCPRSEAVDAETSLVPGFSGKADDAASSVLLAEDAGGVGTDAELRRPPNDNVGNDAGRGVAVVAAGGAHGGTVLLVGWLPNEKAVLLPRKDTPPKLTSPGDPVLVGGRLPKTPAEELLVLALVAAAAAAVLAGTEEVTGGSACFPGTTGPVKLKAEGTSEGLAGCALGRPVVEALLAGLVASSAWPTRSPEKLPRVSPAEELGKSSSPSLDGGASGLPDGVATASPEGAPGLPPHGADSPGDAAAAPLVLVVTPEGEELSGTGSGQGRPPPPKENASSWLDSLAGGVAPGKKERLGWPAFG